MQGVEAVLYEHGNLKYSYKGAEALYVSMAGGGIATKGVQKMVARSETWYKGSGCRECNGGGVEWDV
jgi:hypothetical protein